MYLFYIRKVPTVRINVGSGKALNKLEWEKEGSKAAIGSSDGTLHVYDIGEVIYIYIVCVLIIKGRVHVSVCIIFNHTISKYHKNSTLIHIYNSLC